MHIYSLQEGGGGWWGQKLEGTNLEKSETAQHSKKKERNILAVVRVHKSGKQKQTKQYSTTQT